MNNQTPKTIGPLLAKTRVALVGIRELETTLDLGTNTYARFSTAFYNLAGRPGNESAVPPIEAVTGKQPYYLRCRTEHAAARAAYRQTMSEATRFLEQAIDTLKGMLGRRWTAKWNALGFTSGSLQMPRDPLPTLCLLEAYYRNHPEHEFAAQGLTSAGTAEVLTAIDSAQGSMNEAREKEVAAKAARDAAFKTLRMRLRSLREELSTILSKTDSRWYRFGFRRPSDGETPDLVENVELRPGATGEVIAEWPAARLAVNYRVSWKVTSSTDTPTPLGLFADRLAILTDLPSGTEITVFVSARNDAGESAPMLGVTTSPGTPGVME